MSQSLRCMKYIILYHRNILGCSFDLTATEINQTITSPGYELGFYRSNMRCVWVLTARPGFHVLLDVIDLETERFIDFLKIVCLLKHSRTC